MLDVHLPQSLSIRSRAASKSCSEKRTPSFSTASSETVVDHAVARRNEGQRPPGGDHVGLYAPVSAERGKESERTRTIFRVDRLQYGLEHVVNVHGRHIHGVSLIAEGVWTWMRLAVGVATGTIFSGDRRDLRSFVDSVPYALATISPRLCTSPRGFPYPGTAISRGAPWLSARHDKRL